MASRLTTKIKMLLTLAGRSQVDFAKYLEIAPQSLWNKFNRGSYTAEDLIKLADFVGATLVYEFEGERIVLGTDCIRDYKQKKYEPSEVIEE